MINAKSRLEKLPEYLQQEITRLKAMLRDSDWILDSKHQTLEVFNEVKAWIEKRFPKIKMAGHKAPVRKKRKASAASTTPRKKAAPRVAKTH